jgi:hypothetical protein
MDQQSNSDKNDPGLVVFKELILRLFEAPHIKTPNLKGARSTLLG